VLKISNNQILTNFKLAGFVFLTLVLTLVMAACGDNPNTAAPAPATTGAATGAATGGATTAAVTTGAATAAVATDTTLPTGISATSLTANLNGSGSTLVNPALKVWQTEFGKIAAGVKVNYPAGGSGQGRSDFLTGKTDFGVSDVQVSADEASKNNRQLSNIIQIPATLAAVVFTYNLPGVSDLNLSPEVIGAIYTGIITKWDDNKLKADNPGINLPSLDIKFAVRSDNSGTSDVFTSYLIAVSPDFSAAMGGKSSGQPKWEAAGINVTTASGNDGVAGLVKQTPGTLGYNEVAFALQNNLTYASIKNAAGKFVKPGLDNISAAAADAKPDDNLKVNLINQTGDTTYPIVTTTYFLLNKDYADAAKGQAVVSFAWYAIHKGGIEARDANYAPLPASIVSRAEAKLKTITAGGSTILK
jgi:phosphate transport system substrate-binding protein